MFKKILIFSLLLLVIVFHNIFFAKDKTKSKTATTPPKKFENIVKNKTPLIPPFEAVVAWVTDGDSITAKSNGITIKVRLYGIDAPEKKQPFGKESLANLMKLIKYKRLIIFPIENDKYGRMIARIYTVKKVDKKLVKTYVNLEQVKAGLAWHYKRYSKDAKDLAEAEATAKKNKLGLWSQKNPTNPEVYRHTIKK